MFLALNIRPIVSGGLLHRIQGDKGFAMPPMREIQESGIKWGFGTDAFEVNQFRPFQTLYFAVTGKMVGGTVVNTHTVSREAALIAHTPQQRVPVLPRERSRLDPERLTWPISSSPTRTT